MLEHTDVSDRAWMPNELGTAERFAAEHGNYVKWCETWNCWLRRSGGIWIRDDLVEHRVRAMETGSRQSAANNGEARFLTNRNMVSTLSMGRAYVAVRLSDFDTEPWLLCTPGGVVDLRRGEMRPCGIDDMFLMQTHVTPSLQWSPADTPLWWSHLMLMCKGNLEVMGYLQRLVGMSLIGDQNDKPHVCPQLNGVGRNGKGVFAQAIAYALGDYSQFASTRLLTTTENAHTTEQAGLRGKRFVVVEEVRRINSSLLKDLTGGGVLRARRMRADDEEFPKSWTIWFNNNGPMLFSGDQSDGLWSRVPTVDLGEGIPEEDRIDGMASALRREAEGVLGWALEGLREFLAYGLMTPQSVTHSTNVRRSDADPLREFMNECYERDVESKVLGSELVRAYTAWAKDRDERPGGMKAIYHDLRSRLGLEVKSSDKNKTYIFGVRQKQSVWSPELGSWN